MAGWRCQGSDGARSLRSLALDRRGGRESSQLFRRAAAAVGREPDRDGKATNAAVARERRVRDSRGVRGGGRAREVAPRCRRSRASPPFDGEKAALARLLRSKTPVRIRATADVDVSAALALLKEYGLTGAIVGAREADKLAPQLKDAGIGAIVEIPVVGGVPADTPPRAQRPRDAAKTAAALAAAGVTVAVVPADDALITNIPLLLASAVRGGMSREAAVRAVSADSAKILGVSDRVGVLAPGRDADFLVLTGEPGIPRRRSARLGPAARWSSIARPASARGAKPRISPRRAPASSFAPAGCIRCRGRRSATARCRSTTERSLGSAATWPCRAARA